MLYNFVQNKALNIFFSDHFQHLMLLNFFSVFIILYVRTILDSASESVDETDIYRDIFTYIYRERNHNIYWSFKWLKTFSIFLCEYRASIL